MSSWQTRLRGAIGMAMVWMIAWSVIGVVYGLGMGWLTGSGLVGAAAISGAKLFAGMGFVAGGLFSVLLRLAEGRRRFDELSIGRLVTWGGAGGLVIGGVGSLTGVGGSGFGLEGAIVTGVTTVLGGVSAAATLGVARAAERPAVEAGDSAGRLEEP